MPNRKFDDFKLYVTVAEEDEFLLTTNGEESDERGVEDTEMGNNALSKVAHYIMVHLS